MIGSHTDARVLPLPACVAARTATRPAGRYATIVVDRGRDRRAAPRRGGRARTPTPRCRAGRARSTPSRAGRARARTRRRSSGAARASSAPASTASPTSASLWPPFTTEMTIAGCRPMNASARALCVSRQTRSSATPTPSAARPWNASRARNAESPAARVSTAERAGEQRSVHRRRVLPSLRDALEERVVPEVARRVHERAHVVHAPASARTSRTTTGRASCGAAPPPRRRARRRSRASPGRGRRSTRSSVATNAQAADASSTSRRPGSPTNRDPPISTADSAATATRSAAPIMTTHATPRGSLAVVRILLSAIRCDKGAVDAQPRRAPARAGGGERGGLRARGVPGDVADRLGGSRAHARTVHRPRPTRRSRRWRS